ncbi:hypothetical protein LZ554_001734 [Drepanopeziza brunnea f. sp. 'monogermtubi']|nr:hypothetical protein LZ554_001734 [Drepanopeziza brunnea f. sp. 'monogermtubi']
MLLPQSICSVLLASSFLFSRAQGQDDDNRIIIGYRTVSEDEAEDINMMQRPMRDKAFDMANYDEGHRPIGSGFYMVNVPAGWKAQDEDWHCVIKANKAEFDEAIKVWIPEYMHIIVSDSVVTQLKLWTGNEENIDYYIASLGLFPMGRELLFSRIKGVDTMLQMLIPTDMVNNQDLDLWSQCWRTKDELKAYASETVKWENWYIAGEPGIPER